MSARPLAAFLDPNAVVVVGGSDRPDTVGRVVLRNLIDQGFKGPIHAVNPKPVAMEGVIWSAGIEELPPEIDLAVVATPAATVPGVIAALGLKGVEHAVVLSGGMNEKNGLRAAVAEAARASGLRIIGPNGLGLIAPHARLNASFARGGAEPGRLAFISQSGALVSTALGWASERSLGFSGVVSVGDMVDVDMADLIDLFAADSHTDAILLYVEGVADAAKFLSAARAAARIKPVIAIKAGKTARGRAAALTHTGALAGSYETHACAFERAGVVLVESLEDLFDAAALLCVSRPQCRDRVAIITNGGGAAVLAVDGLPAIGARTAELSCLTQETLDARLPAGWSHGDPIDLLGDADARRYEIALDAALDDPEVDAVIVIHCATAMRSPEEIARAVTARVAERRKTRPTKPVIGCWMGLGDRTEASAIFAAAKLPLFETPTAAVRGFGHLLAAGRARDALMAAPSPRPHLRADPAAARAIFALARAEGRTRLNEIEAKAVLGAYGVPVMPTLFARSIDEVDDACANLSPPYALKLVSPDVTHKSDVGGVALNLPTIGAAIGAARAMRDRLQQQHPDVRISGFAVESMAAAGGHELIVGLSRDPTFGPVVLFGAGGTAVEVLADRSLGLPPLTDDLARDMIARTRVAKLLAGYRNRPAADLTAIAHAIEAISTMAVDLPDIVELDINPLRADASGVVALDARIVITASQELNSPLVIAPPPSGWDADLTTKGGLKVRIRPAWPEDQRDLGVFFEALTPEDLRHRFLTSIKTVDEERLSLIAQVDFRRAASFVALDSATGAILAVALLAGAPKADRAEVAVSVRSDLKGRGLGWSLLEHTLAYAKAVGIRVVESFEAADNDEALKLEREMGFAVRPVADDFGLRVAERALD